MNENPYDSPVDDESQPRVRVLAVLGAIFFFLLATLSVIVAIGNVALKARSGAPFETMVGFAVGSFLVPLVLLIVGLKVWGKRKTPPSTQDQD